MAQPTGSWPLSTCSGITTASQQKAHSHQSQPGLAMLHTGTSFDWAGFYHSTIQFPTGWRTQSRNLKDPPAGVVDWQVKQMTLSEEQASAFYDSLSRMEHHRVGSLG